VGKPNRAVLDGVEAGRDLHINVGSHSPADVRIHIIWGIAFLFAVFTVCGTLLALKLIDLFAATLVSSGALLGTITGPRLATKLGYGNRAAIASTGALSAIIPVSLFFATPPKLLHLEASHDSAFEEHSERRGGVAPLALPLATATAPREVDSADHADQGQRLPPIPPLGTLSPPAAEPAARKPAQSADAGVAPVEVASAEAPVEVASAEAPVEVRSAEAPAEVASADVTPPEQGQVAKAPALLYAQEEMRSCKLGSGATAEDRIIYLGRQTLQECRTQCESRIGRGAKGTCRWGDGTIIHPARSW
jgi:hypothetical protein